MHHSDHYLNRGRAMNKHTECLNDVIRESLVMNERLSAVAMTARHGDPIARVAADSVLNSQRKTVMLQSSIPIKTSLSLHWLIALCLCLPTGCAFSKNLLGKSKLAQPVLPAQIAANPEIAKADCAAPQIPPRVNELTALPVAPPQASQAVANVAPVDNGTQQQPVMQQQPVAEQPYVQQPLVLSAVPQQTPATLQQPVQQQTSQQVAQAMPPVADFAATIQAQGQTAQALPAPTASVPAQSQLTTPLSPGLPPATVQAGLPGSKAVSGPELTATPASAFQAQAHSGSAPAVSPPGMVPNYGYITDAISPPEKMAECEKQVHEMNKKLSELQFDTLKTKTTMEQMAEQQRQLLMDNERLRRRAEMADQRYLEELDSLSEIVGEVVSQTGSANKSNPAAKPSRGTNPLRPLPQSAAGQSL